MARDFSRPQSPRRVTDLLRHLSEGAERERAARQRLASATAAILDAQAEGAEGLAPLLRALAQGAPEVDAAAVVVRDGGGFEVVAGLGVEGRRFDADDRGFVVEAVRGRRLVVARDAGPPLPPGTRAAVAAPIWSRDEVLGAVVAGSRSAHELAEDDLLLARLVAERAGRALERRALVAALSDAEAAARGTAAFRDQVLAIVGHDLRNPLGAIAMSATLLAKRGGLAGWQHKTIGRVRSSAGRMERIIADLLSYTRTRLGGGIPIERRPADLHELARKVVDELVAFHPDTPIHLEAEGDLRGEWDPTRVEQALSNLVSNAVDHGDPEARVEVVLSGDPSAVRVEVRNRGEMPPAVLEHAFEPFRRAADREARRASGLGLGLYIAREIVRGHGGAIRVRSQEGETRLVLALPRRPGDEARVAG